ncbi:MAG: sigma 54-interacting transcriptional regulator [Phycisphaeraceae bacterium]|nr:sigma 54-interacting transcriptional regulator [Phycisphaeraceae bacterium]
MNSEPSTSSGRDGDGIDPQVSTQPQIVMGMGLLPDRTPRGGEDVHLSSRLELLNSQLVLYARDFRRMVQAEQARTRELRHVKQELAEATRRLRRIGVPAPETASPPVEDQDCLVPLIGRSRAMLHVLDLCRRVASTETTVLLTGETGTGKELTARRIHVQSPRRNQPFVAINCGALPEALLESELYGHEKGAFTGAASSKAGLFELANGGTILLDEVGEMPISLQVKLLRVLEERQFRRVGGTRSVSVDVRVIAATNRILKTEVLANRFRADLYYRLNVFPIELPPLRQRVDDIPPLVNYFLVQYAPAEPVVDDVNGSAVPSHAPAMSRLQVHPDVLSALMAYEWPGNIRELRNIMERAVLLTTGPIIELSSLPTELRESVEEPPLPGDLHAAPEGAGAKSRLASHELALIQQALRETRWNKAAAARLLGISWDNLRYRIKKYGLKPPTDR